jgi:NADH-quinone oxidoreductase subunit C
VALDEKGLALQGILPDILAQFQPEIGTTVDMVEVTIGSQELPSLCRTVKEDPNLAFDYLLCLCVVDYVEHLQVVYHLYSITHKHKMVIKTNVPSEQPSVPSVISVWPAADWFEREGHDLFGVVFEGHPNMTPLLLYEGFEGYPGRKSYDFHDYTEW